MRWYLTIVLSISSHFLHMVTPSVSEPERLTLAAYRLRRFVGCIVHGRRRDGPFGRSAHGPKTGWGIFLQAARLECKRLRRALYVYGALARGGQRFPP